MNKKTDFGHGASYLIASLMLLLGCASHAKPPSKSSPSPTEATTVAPASPSVTAPQIETLPKPNADTDVTPFFESNDPANLPAEGEGPPEVVEKIIGEEAEEEIAKSSGGKVPTFDFPIVMNKMVEKWINYFQTRGRDVFAAWLSRSERYIPMMKRILRENGLPEDLIYLAMIESGFKPYAYSRAKASGQWQFMKATGARYGLRVNWWIDERRDPEKSSIAAAQHLKDLYDQFNSWYLAAASYNAGAGKISNAIRRYSTEDFWEMSRYRYLKPETKNYVPKIIAAALIAKEPEKYGFTNIKYDEPIEYDKVIVPAPTQLSVIAQEMGIAEDQLTELNQELKRGITPPNTSNWELRVPKGTREKFMAAYPEMRRKSATRVVRHVVERKETLAQIASGYGVSAEKIRSFNRLSQRRLKAGTQLAIPLSGGIDRPMPKVALVESKRKEKSSKYTVRRGDTLWSISRRFDVSVAEIRAWNHFGPKEDIRAGQKLRINAREDPSFLQATNAPGPSPTPALPETKVAKAAVKDGNWKTYVVQAGDSLWSISKSYSVKVQDIEEWNDLDASDLRPGMRLKIKSTGM